MPCSIAVGVSGNERSPLLAELDQRAQLPGLDLGRDRGARTDDHVDVTGGAVIQQRRGAPVGHMHQLYAGELAQGGHREVPVAADTGGPVGQPAGLAFAAATSSGSVR